MPKKPQKSYLRHLGTKIQAIALALSLGPAVIPDIDAEHVRPTRYDEPRIKTEVEEPKPPTEDELRPSFLKRK